MEFPDDAINTIEMVEAAHDHYPGEPEKLCKLLEDADKPLYKGCKKFTKLSALVELFNIKAKSGLSDKYFTEFLTVIKKLLPEKNELPKSTRVAKDTLSTFGMDYKKIHACPNDCILYRGEYENAVDCSTCGESRYKESMGMTEKKSCSPKKLLWYFSPIPRFRKMFQSAQTAKNLVWHANEREVVEGLLRHPADSPAWKEVDNKWPGFAEDSRNLRLALSTDGINPYCSLSSRHSCWPVMLITYNLPPWLFVKRKFLMLTMLISGPRQPGNDIDVYLRPLIDDLKTLWHNGVEAYDAYKQESFTLRAVLLWTISDFPAYGNLAGCNVKGYFACPVCNEETDSIRLTHSKKNVYLAHRRYLLRTHRYRKLKKAFNGMQELRSSPKCLSGKDILQKVNGIKVLWGKPRVEIKRLKTTKKKCVNSKRKRMKNIVDVDENRTCWKKKSIFFELEYWEHLLVRHNLDVMHIEKNVCDNIIGTLLNIPGKTKDGLQSRQDLVDMNIKNELAPEVRGSKTYLPPACYTLTKEEKERVCGTLHDLKVPDGYCSNFKHRVSLQELKLYGLKSHDCHVLMQQLLPVAIRSVLPKHVRYTIVRVCFFFSALCAKVVDIRKLHQIQNELVDTLCMLEMYFLPSFFDIMVHLMVHLVKEVELCGPVFFRWMYPFERFMMVLKGYVRNRYRPEGCIAENYIAEEAVEFCSEFLDGLDAVGVPQSRNIITGDKETGKPLGGTDVVVVDKLSWEQAHLCVLQNVNVAQPYIKSHMDSLRDKYPGKTPKWLQDEHNRSFIYWLREKVSDEETIPNNNLPDTLKVLAQRPRREVIKCSGYVINGCRFHTKNHEASLVNQNSGVSITALGMQISSDTDMDPISTNMCYYCVIKEIWLLDYLVLKIPVFKCDWVDNGKGVRVDELGFTSVKLDKTGYKSDPFILSSQAKQVFYVPDQIDPNWSIALSAPQRDYHDDEDDYELNNSYENNQNCNLTDMDTFNSCDSSILSYTRADCEGTWID